MADQTFGNSLHAAGLRLRRLFFLVVEESRTRKERIERHAVDFGVFGLEMALIVQGMTHPSQTTADDLFAEQLRPERTDAENVRYRRAVPAFGQHGHGDD